MTLLEVSVDIIEILDIDEIDSKINIKFELTVTWNDARIYFKSLQKRQENNIIPNFEDIWRPTIKVMNSLSRNEFIEDDVTVTAKKYGSGLLNGDDLLLKDHIFIGTEINITRNSKHLGSFHCTFDNLAKYPFDTETCSLDTQVSGNAYRFTKLIPKTIKYRGPQSLANYIIKGDIKFKTKSYLKSTALLAFVS